MRRAGRVLAALGVLYAFVCLLARWLYPSVLYPAPRGPAPPLPVPWEERSLGTPAHPVRAVTRVGAPGAPLVVWFHGNGERCEDQVAQGEHFSARGLGFAALEYPGYGALSALTPSEEALYADAELALSVLEREAAARGSPVVLVGYSLGSAIAAEMALRGHGARLVLVAPFTSMTAMGRALAPFLPVSLLMTERYDTLSKAPRIRMKSLVIHGDQDHLVPFEMGQSVAAALPDATFVRAASAGHVGIFGASAEALARLDAFADGAR